MHVVKLCTRSGNLTVTIPRALAREMGWNARQLVTIARVGSNGLAVIDLEVHLADAKRLRAYPLEADPRAESPTAREHRTGSPGGTSR